MMTFSHTDARILKLLGKGLTPEQVARKIGRPGDVERVQAAIRRATPGDENNSDFLASTR